MGTPSQGIKSKIERHVKEAFKKFAKSRPVHGPLYIASRFKKTSQSFRKLLRDLAESHSKGAFKKLRILLASLGILLLVGQDPVIVHAQDDDTEEFEDEDDEEEEEEDEEDEDEEDDLDEEFEEEDEDEEDDLDEEEDDVETAEEPLDAEEPKGDPLRNLPDIEARTYSVSVERISKSLRVYLLNDARPTKPRVGKIILLRNSADENAMAFRVLTIYPDRGQFAAGRVRKYGDIHVLEAGESFTAIEKIADVVPIPGGESDLDRDDIDEIEDAEGIDDDEGEDELDDDLDIEDEGEREEGGEADESDDDFDEELDDFDEDEQDDEDLPELLAYDPELDEQEGLTFNLKALTIEEVRPLDRWGGWLSVMFGFFQQGGTGGGGSYFSGFGVRGAANVSSRIFMTSPFTQDSLSIEGGLFLYTVNALAGADDTFTIAPLIGTARYNIFLSESFLIHLYGGLLFNFVVSANSGSLPEDGQEFIQAEDSLGGLQLATGAGFMFRFGPQWLLRFEFGLDSIGTGLVLRF